MTRYFSASTITATAPRRIAPSDNHFLVCGRGEPERSTSKSQGRRHGVTAGISAPSTLS
jgi:hypothetical protein